MSGQELVSMACISQFKMYIFFAPIIDRIPDNTTVYFTEPIEFRTEPFQIIDYISDHDQHLIMLLTSLQGQYFVHVVEFAISQGDFTLIWRAKTDPLPHIPRIGDQTHPTLFYSWDEKILIIVSHFEEYIMSYQVTSEYPVISPQSIFKNPYYMNLFHGRLLCIHFIKHEFLLLVYDDALVIARGTYSFPGEVTSFDFFKQFLQNEYIHVAYSHYKLMLFRERDLSFYDFSDPFLPELLRINTIPYPGYKYYVSSRRGMYVTSELHHSVLAIVEREEDKTFHLLCYRTNTKMTHDSLLFMRQLGPEIQQEIHKQDYLRLFGCKCDVPYIADPNILFFSLNTSVVMHQIHLDHILKIETPTLEIPGNETLNLIVKPDLGCTFLHHQQGPCELEVPLLGQMSGTVVKISPGLNRDQSIDITFKRPEMNNGLIMESYFQGYDLKFQVVDIKSDPRNLGEPLLTVPNYVCHFDIPTQSTITNITDHLFIESANLEYPVLLTFDVLQTVSLHQTLVTDGDWVQIVMLQTLTLSEFDSIQQLMPLTQQQPPATYWIVYGWYQNNRRLVMYNATSIYTVHSRYLDLSQEAINDFTATYIQEPWYVPLKWFFDSENGYLLIQYSYNNPYDEPLIFYKIDFSLGQIYQVNIINAILLRLNTFSSGSFFVHNQYPLLVSAGKGPLVTLVDLSTQTYLHSIDITEYDEVLQSFENLEISWLNQNGPSEFHAFIQGYGMLTFNFTMLVPYNDIDSFNDIEITMVDSIHERGVLDTFKPLQSPFAQYKNLILGLFFRTEGQFELKMFNSYEAKRSKVVYSVHLDQYRNCFRPRFFRPPNTKIGQIFASLICNGQLLIFKLSEFFYLKLDYDLIVDLDPTSYPITQTLSIKAYNTYDTRGVTLDFNVSVQKYENASSTVVIGVSTVIIFVLIAVFLVAAWTLRTLKKNRKMSIRKKEEIEIQEMIMQLQNQDNEEIEEDAQMVGTPGEVELTEF